jgi:RHS repeat-associated protein
MSTALRTYYRGANQVTLKQGLAQERRTYHFDHQGTTQCLTDSTGTVTDRFASDAWGVQVRRTGTGVNRQWYIGSLGYYSSQSPNRITYVRARHLMAVFGQWISKEPIRHMWPVYQYSRNSPIAFVDPDGLLCRLVAFVVKSVPTDIVDHTFTKQTWQCGCVSIATPPPPELFSILFMGFFATIQCDRLTCGACESPTGWKITQTKFRTETCDGKMRVPPVAGDDPPDGPDKLELLDETTCEWGLSNVDAPGFGPLGEGPGNSIKTPMQQLVNCKPPYVIRGAYRTCIVDPAGAKTCPPPWGFETVFNPPNPCSVTPLGSISGAANCASLNK